MIVLVAQGCRKLRAGGKKKGQAGGWAVSAFLLQFRGLTLGSALPWLPLALCLVLCSAQLLAWRLFYAAAAAAGPAAWPRCSVAACRPESGTPAAGSMPQGSGRPGLVVPTQYGSNLQLSGSPPKSGPVENDGSHISWHSLNSHFSLTDGNNTVSALRQFLTNGTDKLGPQAED